MLCFFDTLEGSVICHFTNAPTFSTFRVSDVPEKRPQMLKWAQFVRKGMSSRDFVIKPRPGGWGYWHRGRKREAAAGPAVFVLCH